MAGLNVDENAFLDRRFFAGETVSVARTLLGTELIYSGASGIIVETEAYRDDPASHAVTRPKKGVLLRESYGLIYIYLIYGMHYCLNFTTEAEGVGAVLIRAVEPVQGIEAMARRRGTDKVHNLTSGPAKLFQAFGLDAELHGHEVGSRLRLRGSKALGRFAIGAGRRIGISKATELPWRFFVKDNPFLSRKS